MEQLYCQAAKSAALNQSVCALLFRNADGDVVRATKTIAAGLAMKNDFPVFMSVMDVAWFRPDLIDPASPVPTGIGAVAYLDILQRHLGLATHEEAASKMIELQASQGCQKQN